MLQNVKKYGMYTHLLGGVLLTSCSDDDEAPEQESVVEAFTDPVGDGNIDGNTTGTEVINYIDNDNNGDPVGLFTSWTTSSDLLTDGEFRVRLQHQPDVKTSTSGVNDGDTDFDLTFVLNIE